VPTDQYKSNINKQIIKRRIQFAKIALDELSEYKNKNKWREKKYKLQNKYIQLSYGGYEGVCRMEVCKGYGQKT
jgi:hypothetical protein